MEEYDADILVDANRKKIYEHRAEGNYDPEETKYLEKQLEQARENISLLRGTEGKGKDSIKTGREIERVIEKNEDLVKELKKALSKKEA